MFNDASNAARLALLKWRAELIYEYEVIERIFQHTENEPAYIYYVGQSRIFEKWEEKSKEQRRGFKSLEHVDELMKNDDDEEELPEEASVDRFWNCDCEWKFHSKDKKDEIVIVKENDQNDQDDQILLLQNHVNTLNDKITSMEKNFTELFDLIKKQTEEK